MVKWEQDNARKQREEMVKSQIISRGVRDERVLEAMRTVPRERFVREDDRQLAFFDGPLSIGCGQTISQPYIVAYMTEMLHLKENDRVLEIGTGCGYQTAVIAEIAREVYTIEIVERLARCAHEALDGLGYTNVQFRTGDGNEGWPEKSPFDAIIITAAPERVPKTLISQLADGGRLIAPVGGYMQYLVRLTRNGEEIDRETLIGVRFVPMMGFPRDD
ncbi:MAG TPA: protein-L-isoaspartate(D-aspartate) O-methyltransferase [Patescibacteria group bacterium]|nr:protein-L-isoaspartate(D-aspartate) O-methyltransferase [Patescibacteria group bacterium]